MRQAFRAKFPDMLTEADFERHTPADPEDVDRYEAGGHRGPDEEDLHVDVLSGRSSGWNNRVIDILYNHILGALEVIELPTHQEGEIRSLIRRKLARAQVSCRAAMPKALRDGGWEASVNAIARRDAQKKEKAKADRHNMRRHTVSGPSVLCSLGTHRNS